MYMYVWMPSPAPAPPQEDAIDYHDDHRGDEDEAHIALREWFTAIFDARPARQLFPIHQPRRTRSSNIWHCSARFVRYARVRTKGEEVKEEDEANEQQRQEHPSKSSGKCRVRRGVEHRINIQCQANRVHLHRTATSRASHHTSRVQCFGMSVVRPD